MCVCVCVCVCVSECVVSSGQEMSKTFNPSQMQADRRLVWFEGVGVHRAYCRGVRLRSHGEQLEEEEEEVGVCL